MRRIGSLENETLAHRFCDYLLTLSIDAAADSDASVDNPQWDIWIRDEQDVDEARNQFALFVQSPESDTYQVKSKADALRDKRVSEQQQKLAERKKLHRTLPTSGGRPAMGGLGGSSFAARQQNIPVAIGVIVLSVIASFAGGFGRPRLSPDASKLTSEQSVDYAMSFVDRRDYAESDGDWFASIRKGEVWRFITPMFLHADPLHLAFNMIWIFLLGSAIERLQGSLFLAVLLFVSQLAGMLLQVSLPGSESLPPMLHALAGSPFAIGASGAVYGLFGYLWIRPQMDASFPIRLSQGNVMLMLGWLVLCMTGMFGPIANGAHLGGLLAGVAAAFLISHKR
ncbi:Rhomboid protease GlpG [Novipirellula galeiformis]|uniref:Rhomboid protease GlpG n=1 Tax=Novipirellula galeiformis TaxID=2528004 RepID=A0A5C6BZU9_9BACT|nr:rhomboid family intramembrane serine protease [Novipirellula galeiformis]TWU17382.1 Rhomboid protease GlpG [Novipirellula galeiformis]